MASQLPIARVILQERTLFSVSFVLEFAQVTNKQDKAAQSSALNYILGFTL